jgi:hypothetical protein
MRAINISNDKKRDAVVGFEGCVKKSAVVSVLPSGGEKRNVRFVKTTASAAALEKKHGDMKTVAEALAAKDDEIDMEVVGKIISGAKKMYVDKTGSIAYRVTLKQIIHNPDGSEKERKEASATQATIAGELPLVWTGKSFKRNEAIRKFVFTKSYQLRHTNGLSYDFLFGMAKQLADEDSLMLIGAGKKGSEPIILASGGEPYRGFLEGRVEGDKYLLLLHLTNLEVKPLDKGGEK